MKKNSFSFKKPNWGFIALMTVFFCFFANSAMAQVTNTNFFWGGTVDNSWSTAANWSTTGRYVHTANYSSGSTTVTIVTANLQGAAPTTVLAVGHAIVGPGIPANTTVAGTITTPANGTTITLSQPTTAAGSAAVIQTYLKATFTPFATTGTASAGTTATAIIDNAAINSPVVSTNPNVSIVLLRNSFGAQSGPTLTINSGSTLNVTNFSASPLSLAGGNIVNNGTLNITSNSTGASTGISCIVPTVLPTSATEYSYSGTGALNINISASTTANSAGINVSSLNSNTTYKMLFNGTATFTLGSVATSYALRNAGGALISPLIIGGAGFTMGTVGSPVTGGLLSVGQQSTVTINAGTTLTLNSASTNLTSGVLVSNSSTTATTFTNKGTINILGSSARSGLQFNTFTQAGAIPFTIANEGIINVNLNSVTTGTGALITGNGGGAGGAGTSVNINNTGTLTLINTSTATGTGAAIFGLVASEAPAVVITNNGTMNVEGSSYSYGNKFSIVNNSILNSNSELRSFTAITNNVGGSINFSKTAATATTRQVVFNGLTFASAGALGATYSDGTNSYVIVNQKYTSASAGTTLVANVLSSATVGTGSGTLTLTSGTGDATIAFTSVSVPALNNALSSTTTNSGTVNTDTTSNLNIISGVSAASTGTIAPGGASGKGIADFSNGSTLAINSTLKLNVSGSATAGVDYDEIINSAAGGGFDITGATLDVTGIYSPSGYTVIDILACDAAGTLTGNFASVVGLGSGWSVAYNTGTAGKVQLVKGSAAVPTITRLSSNGTNTITSACEGSTLVIIGTNLTGVSEITVGGVALTGVNDVSSTRAEGILPIGAIVGKVIVTTPGGTVQTSGNLTVVENSTVVTAVSACDTYTWANNGQTYTTSGTYTGTTSSCVTQQLVLNIVTTPAPIVSTISQCGSSYVWPSNGVTYTASGTYNVLVGCTAETLNLTLTAPTTTGSETRTECGTSYTWPTSGATYTSSGTYDYVVGCNTATLNLTLTPNTTTGNESVSACGSSYTWPTSGQTYNASGVYPFVSGCNTATLTLTLTPATTTGSVTTTACGGYTWPVNNVTYTSSTTQVVTVGCNTATLNLTITLGTTTGSESVSACGSSYTWPVSGLTYNASGVYPYVVGCNVATLTLTLTPYTTTGNESVSACGSSYTWATSGATYTSSGTYDYVVGCNTATLTLTLTPATTTGSESVSACGSSYTWATSGATYTASGTYDYVVGCNTATLTLTLTPATSTGSVTLTQNGGSYTWPANGQTYSSSTTQVVTVGCNTATLNLTINNTDIPASPYAVCTGATVGSVTAGTTLKFYKDIKPATLPYAGTQKLAAATYYVTEVPTGGVEGPRTAVTVTLTALVPAPALSSTESKNICKYIGTTNLVTFTSTSTAVPAPTSYSWTVPVGAFIDGSATGSSVQVNFFGASAIPGLIGAVTVDAKNSLGCPSGKPKLLALTTKAPKAPKSVVLTYNAVVIKKGGNFVGDASKTLTLTAIDESGTADHHVWTLPAGTTVVTGDANNDLVLTVHLGGVAASNDPLLFSCASVAGCATSTKTLSVARAEAGTPKAITLTDSEIPALLKITKLDAYTGALKTRMLTLTATPNTKAGSEATSYKWVLPAQATTTATPVIGEANTYTSTLPTISVNLANVGAEASFVFKVYGVNGNGTSLLSKDLTCTSAAPKAPSAIYRGDTGSGTLFTTYSPSCGVVTLSVPSVLGVTYSFTTNTSGVVIGAVVGNSVSIDFTTAPSALKSTVVLTATATTGTGSASKVFIVKLGACAGGKIAPERVIADEFRVIAYPNPSSSEFTIEASSKGATNVQVYDMVGRLIENRQATSNSVQVGRNYATGVYNVIVSQGTQVKTLRVIKK